MRQHGQSTLGHSEWYRGGQCWERKGGYYGGKEDWEKMMEDLMYQAKAFGFCLIDLLEPLMRSDSSHICLNTVYPLYTKLQVANF